MIKSLYSFKVKSIQGDIIDLSQYRGQVLLIVNTASYCGFTPQFNGLQKLYLSFKDRGFSVLGFPCNQFQKQDPGSNEEILNFCQINYQVSFPMFSKLEVNGKNTDPMYEYLKSKAPGSFITKKIKWNFTKFLINRDGQVIRRFAPYIKPEKLIHAIEDLL